jgi:hypothetical protein
MGDRILQLPRKGLIRIFAIVFVVLFVVLTMGQVRVVVFVFNCRRK